MPSGFQRAEFQVEHGFVDAIVPREEQKEMLTKLLKVHAWKEVNETVTWEQQSYETGEDAGVARNEAHDRL